MKNKNIIYENEDFFMVRTPIKSYQCYKNIFSENDLEKNVISLNTMFSDSVFLESVYATSEDLVESIINQNQLMINNEKIISSVLKYFIRMSTRTTPFGLFSGIGIGSFSNETKFLLNETSKHIKRARPSMEWIFSLISKLEQDNLILNELLLIQNNSICNVFDRLELVDNTCLNINLNKETDLGKISIKNSELVQYVLSVSKSGIKYKKLKQLLIEKYSIDYEKNIVQFLETLLKKEFLITELRPALTCSKPLEYILSKIFNQYYLKEIHDIKVSFDKYNELSIGSGKGVLSEISNKMKEITIAKKYVQIDTKLDLKNAVLNKNIQKDICECATTLAYISSIEKNDVLEEYKIAFMDRYDAEREVKLLDLINYDIGIGYPNWEKVSEDNNKTFGIILNKLIKGISKHTEVSFGIDDFKSVINQSKKDDLIESAELNIIIKAKSEQDIDLGKYELFLGPNIGSNDTCKTFGRFIDILNLNEKNKIKNAQKLDNKTDETIVVGLNFIPQNSTISNIAINENYRDYEITLGTNNSLDKIQIDLKDIVVGINNDKFYLRDIKLNKFINIKSDNMVNTRYIPKIFKFLYYISNEGKSILPSSFLKIISILDYVPRIKIENIILQPAQWKFSKEIFLNEFKKLDLDVFKNRLVDKMKELNIPQYVYQVKYDNRLLFNLENELHLKELFNILKREGKIAITEIDSSEVWIKDIENNLYTAEFIFPIRLKKNIKRDVVFKEEDSLCILKNRFLEEDVFQREQFLCENWIYFKFYSIKEIQEELLINELKKVCSELLEKNFISEFFFIRYADPKNHIRLRLKGNSDILIKKVFPRFIKLIDELKKNKKIYRVVADTYRREVERYGGVKLIELAEKIFYYDSLIVLELLSLNDKEFLLEDFAFCSICNYLNAFNLSLNEQVDLLDRVIDYSFNRKEFNMKRKFYIELCDLETQNILTKYEKTSKYLKLRDEEIRTFISKVNIVEKSSELTNYRSNIYNSIIHLHCNRLFGVDRLKEKKVLTLVRNSIYVLKNLKEKKK